MWWGAEVEARRERASLAGGADETLGDILRHIQPGLGTALVDDEGLSRLMAIAGAVPAALSPFWGLEIRLGEPAARADLLWEVRHGAGARLLLDGGPAEVAALHRDSPVWRALGRFARDWLSAPAEQSAVGNIWFEADAASAADDASARAMLARPCLFWGATSARPGSDRELLAALPQLATDVFGLELPPDRLDAAAAALPRGAEIFQMGVMGGRQGTLTRLCVRNLSIPESCGWLRAIGWPGDIAAAAGRLEEWAILANRIALNVDLLPDGIGPRLGVEVYQPFGSVDPAPWRPLLDRLGGEGLTRSDKAAALLAFPGEERFSQDEVWRARRGVGDPVLLRSIHHLKLVLAGDRITEAKAYLGVYRPGFDYGGFFGEAAGEATDGWLRA